MLRGLLRSLGGAGSSAPAASAPAAAPAQAPAMAPTDLYAAINEAGGRGDHAATMAIFRAHLAAQPDDIDAIATCGGYLIAQERFDEAQEVLAPALERYPNAAQLLYNAGSLAQARMRTDEAISLYRLALAAQPGFPMARFMLAIQLMLKGEYREGLLHFRARNDMGPEPATAWPRNVAPWEGQSLAGKRLLVWLDWGGLGDELQFARYLAPLARQYRPAALIFGCSDAGRRLYAAIPGVDLAASSFTDPNVDYQIALLDLPIVFGTTLANMPPADPYLAADPADVARWKERLAGLHGRRVGLVWSSGFWGKTTRSDKSLPLELLAPLAALPDTHFISLQKGPGRDELPCPGLTILDFDAELNDLADTAALIENLDVVVSVDTSVAHLAGGLGKPVILMLKWESGNFWLLGRSDSPWYPGMRIARQDVPRDWSGVVRQVKDWLAGWPPVCGVRAS